MSLSILTNISALQAQSQLSNAQANLGKALAQLSSGSKINSGADDAAGLSIANAMQASIGALTQSAQNATNSIGLLQTADGALAQVTTLLNRAITLATEASNSGLTSSQTAALDLEFQSILTQINSVGGTTTFNSSQVFSANTVTPYLGDGSGGNMLGSVPISIGTLTTGGLLNVGTNATDAGNTLTLTANVVDGNTINIGNTTYTFTSGAGGGTNVHIGVTPADTLANLAAIVDSNAGDTTVHASASGNILTIVATTAGSAGNNLAAASTLTAAPTPTGTWSTTGTPGDLGGGTSSIPATSALTLTGVPSDGSTITIGSITYTFRNAASVAGDVQIGGDASQTAFNLALTLNGGDGRIGANGTVSASRSGSTVTFTAKTAGTAGNLLVASGTVAGSGAPIGTWTTTGAAGYMGGGVDTASAQSTLTLTGNVADGDIILIGATTYTFRTSPSAAGDVQIGGNATQTLSNLAQAVNGLDGRNSANASEFASASGTSISFIAKTAGAGGNLLAASGTLEGAVTQDGTWTTSGSAGFFGGGTDATAASADFGFAQPSAGNTITVGSTTYTFVNSLTGDNQVLIGSDAQSAWQHLAEATNGDLTGKGTDYSANLNANDAATVTYRGNDAAWGHPTWADVYFQATAPGTSGNGTPVQINGGSGGNWTLWGGTDATIAGAQLTLDTNPSAGESVNIGRSTYVFTSGAGSGNMVQIGATAADTLNNLVYAIGHNLYDASVNAVANSNVLTLTSNIIGAGGNSLAASGTLAMPPAGTWSANAGTLAGGTGTASGNYGCDQVSNGSIFSVGGITYTFVNSITGNDQVLIGSDAQSTWQHLAEAVNGTATGKGTDYSANLNANPSATVTYLGPNGAWGFPNAADILVMATSPGSGGNNVRVIWNGGSNGDFYLTGGSDTPTVASNQLTLTSNLESGSTITLGTKTYTFQSGVPTSAGQVQIGSDAATTLQNLASAVNGNGLNAANPDMSALASGNQITITANAVGNSGNYLAAYGTLLAPAAAVSNWSTTGSAGYLGGGINGASATSSLTMTTNVAQGSTVTVGSTTYTFRNPASVPGDVQIGGNAAGSLTNLATAVNGDALNSVNPAASAAAVGTTITFTSKTAGSAGDNTQTTSSLTSPGGTVSSWSTSGSAGYLGGGVNPIAATASLTLTSNLAAGSTATIGNTTYTFISGASSGTNVHIDTTAAATLSNLATAVNGNGGDTSVQASAIGNMLTFTAATAGSGGNSLAATGNLSTPGGGSAGTWSSNGGTLTGGSDASAGGTPLDLNTTANAQAALLAVTSGVSQLASWRGTVGAYINQLQAATNVVMAESQNLTSASSSISDADVAKAIADLTRYTVLEFTGMAALQQATQASQSFLKLLA